MVGYRPRRREGDHREIFSLRVPGGPVVPRMAVIAVKDGAVLFQDRRDAGRQLAEALSEYERAAGVQILALPRGGVIVGDEISRALRLPLEVLVTRKLGAPGNPELAMGALTETGSRHVNALVRAQFGVSDALFDAEVSRQEQEIRRRVEVYRQGRPLPPLAGGRVILTDDGFATGATFLASLACLRALGVAHLVAAIPVAPADARQALARQADRVLVLHMPERFFAIGAFYDDFSQTEDGDVIDCLARARAREREEETRA